MQGNSVIRCVSLTFLAVVGVLLAATKEVVARDPEYRPARGSMTAAMADATWTDASRNREVPARIYAPGLEHGRGPFPTVVFSHGGGESREAFDYLGSPLAQNGYIVVFMTHRGSDREALRRDGIRSLGASAFEDRPKDIVFVLDRLQSPKVDDELLAGRVDTDRIAVAGQCAGASTVLAITGLTTKRANGTLRSYRDPRPKAVVALSPQPGAVTRRRMPESLHDDSWKTVAVPALVVTGTKDFRWTQGVRQNPAMVNRPYTGMTTGDKYLVEIADAEHHAFTDSTPYYPGGPRDPRHHGWIAQATVTFLDAYLRDDQAARTWLQTKRLQASTNGECRQEQKLESNVAREETSSAPSGDVGVIDTIRLMDRERNKPLHVRVTHPSGEGRFPVLLFSHCVGGSRRDFEPLIRHWAASGYVCIQADHSDSRLAGDPNARRLDFRNRARDLSFLIDSLGAIEEEAPDLEGKLNRERIGAGGHLIGAYASCLLVGMKVYTRGESRAPEVFKDERVDAAMLLSPQGRGQGLTERSWDTIAKPMLVMAGSETASRRTGNSAQWRTEPFTFARPVDKYLFFIDGLDNRYDGLVLDRGSDDEMSEWIRTATLAFWDAHLKDSSDGKGQLAPERWQKASGGQVEVQHR